MTLTLVEQREEGSKTDERRRRNEQEEQEEAEGGRYWEEGEGARHFKAIQKLTFGIGQEQTVVRGSTLTHQEMGHFQHRQQIFVPGGRVGPSPIQPKPPPLHQNLSYQKLHHDFVLPAPHLPIPSSYQPYLPRPFFKANHVPRHQSWSQPINCERPVEGSGGQGRMRQHLPFPPPYHLVQPNLHPHQAAHVAQGGRCAQVAPDSQYS